MAILAIFGHFCYFIPILMQQELSWSWKMSFMTTLWNIKKIRLAENVWNPKKTTRNWPKTAIFAHFLPFLLHFTSHIVWITQLMLNAVNYNHTVAFLRNWPAFSVLNFKKWQKMAVFGFFCYFNPSSMQQELS